MPTPCAFSVDEVDSTSAPQAPHGSAVEEARVLFELWRLTGFDAKQLPPHAIFRRALWEENAERAAEGRRLRVPIGDAARSYADPPDEGCGVDPFS